MTEHQSIRASQLPTKIRAIIGAILILLCVCQPAHAGDASPKVVCFGDSITKRGYPEELGKILGVTVVNAGIPGNTTADGLKRLQTDVLDQNPSVVIVLFGTNDSRLDSAKVHVPVEKYISNLKQIITRCEAIHARVVLCTIPPIEPEPYFKRHKKQAFDAAGGLASVLTDYRAAVLRIGAEHRLPVVDLNAQLISQPSWLSPDGVHPSSVGHTLLAKLIAEKTAPLIAQRRP